MAGLREIPNFQTLSRRASMIDLHAINNEITTLYSMESIAAVDSFMIHTCKHSTAMRRKAWNNYKDPLSGCSKTTKGNLHDSHEAHDMVYSCRFCLRCI